MTSNSCDEFPIAPVILGNLTILKEGLRLSTGLTVTLLAKPGELVKLSSPEARNSLSAIPFHVEPDGAAVFQLDDGG